MTRSNDDSAPVSFPEGEERPLYERVSGLLLNALTHRFHLPQREAEALLFETFTVYQGLERKPRDPVVWIIGAACRHAQGYLRVRGLPVPVDCDTLEAALVQRAAIDTLPELARKALRLRYGDKRSFEEIAEELGVSTHAAKRLVAKAVTSLKALGRQQG